MKKKLMTGLAVGFLVFCMVWSSGAATIELHSTGQLGGITEVEFADGSFWDATFYNQWSQSSQELYTGGFADNASLALFAVFNTLEFSFYDANPQMTWGIETPTFVGIGNLITPTQYIAATSGGGGNMSGYAFVNRGTFISIVGLWADGTDTNSALITGYNFHDQDDTHSYVQWTQSATGNPVPIPSTVILLGIGLLGLAGIHRGKK